MKGKKNIKTFQIHILEMNDGMVVMKAVPNVKQTKSKGRIQTAPSINGQRSQDLGSRRGEPYRVIKAAEVAPSRNRKSKSCIPIMSMSNHKAEKQRRKTIRKHTSYEWIQAKPSAHGKQKKQYETSKICVKTCCKNQGRNDSPVCIPAKKKAYIKRPNKQMDKCNKNYTEPSERYANKTTPNQNTRRPNRRHQEQMKLNLEEDSEVSSCEAPQAYNFVRRGKKYSPRRQKFLQSCQAKNTMEKENRMTKQKSAIKTTEPLSNRFQTRKCNVSADSLNNVPLAEKPEKKVTFADTCSYRTIDSSAYAMQWMDDDNHLTPSQTWQQDSDTQLNDMSDCNLEESPIQSEATDTHKTISNSSGEGMECDGNTNGLNDGTGDQTQEEFYENLNDSEYNNDDEITGGDAYDYKMDNDYNAEENVFETNHNMEREDIQNYSNAIDHVLSSESEKLTTAPKRNSHTDESGSVDYQPVTGDTKPEWKGRRSGRNTSVSWNSGEVEAKDRAGVTTPAPESNPRKKYGGRTPYEYLARLQERNNNLQSMRTPEPRVNLTSPNQMASYSSIPKVNTLPNNKLSKFTSATGKPNNFAASSNKLNNFSRQPPLPTFTPPSAKPDTFTSTTGNLTGPRPKPSSYASSNFDRYKNSSCIDRYNRILANRSLVKKAESCETYPFRISEERTNAV